MDFSNLLNNIKGGVNEFISDAGNALSDTGRTLFKEIPTQLGNAFDFNKSHTPQGSKIQSNLKSYANKQLNSVQRRQQEGGNGESYRIKQSIGDFIKNGAQVSYSDAGNHTIILQSPDGKQSVKLNVQKSPKLYNLFANYSGAGLENVLRKNKKLFGDEKEYQAALNIVTDANNKMLDRVYNGFNKNNTGYLVSSDGSENEAFSNNAWNRGDNLYVKGKVEPNHENDSIIANLNQWKTSKKPSKDDLKTNQYVLWTSTQPTLNVYGTNDSYDDQGNLNSGYWGQAY